MTWYDRRELTSKISNNLVIRESLLWHSHVHSVPPALFAIHSKLHRCHRRRHYPNWTYQCRSPVVEHHFVDLFGTAKRQKKAKNQTKFNGVMVDDSAENVTLTCSAANISISSSVQSISSFNNCHLACSYNWLMRTWSYLGFKSKNV